MSRDKYSENHTMTITEGTGTLTVGGNLTVNSAATITGQLNINGNAVVQAGDTITSDNFTFTTALTGYLSIPACAFYPNSADLTLSGTTGLITNTAADSASKAAIAMVRLPTGAIITEVSIYGNLTSATAELTFNLNKMIMTTAVVATIATATATGSTGDISATDSSISSATTDAGALWLLVILKNSGSSNQCVFHGVKITFTIANVKP